MPLFLSHFPWASGSFVGVFSFDFTLLLFLLFLVVLDYVLKEIFQKPAKFFLMGPVFLSIQVFCWSFVNQVIEPLFSFLQNVAPGKVTTAVVFIIFGFSLLWFASNIQDYKKDKRFFMMWRPSLLI